MVHVDAGATQELRVARIDRNGKKSAVDPDWLGRFNFLALSPDGRQLALSVIEGGHTDLWIKQLDHGPLTRLTFEGNINYRPAWTPDGRSVGFISDRTGRSLPYVARADGSGPTARIAIPDTNQIDEIEWSRDGQWMVYRTGVVAGLRRIGKWRIGDSTAAAIEPGRFDQYMPTLSPDGRWLAYVTVESGREQVYVRPFPNTSDARWQVSSAGGSSPVWSRSGRELFFADSTNQIVAVAVTPGAISSFGTPSPLFPMGDLILPPCSPGLRRGARWHELHLPRGSQRSLGQRSRYAVLTLNWLDELTSPRLDREWRPYSSPDAVSGYRLRNGARVRARAATPSRRPCGARRSAPQTRGAGGPRKAPITVFAMDVDSDESVASGIAAS